MSSSPGASIIEGSPFRGGPERLLKSYAARALSALARPFYSGIGAILCLHRVIPREQRSLLPDNRALEITPEDLDALIRQIHSRGYEIISMGELPGALQSPPRRRFIAFSFDDGYVDNLTNALPIFQAHSVPFTVNITTSFANGTGLVWWHALEHLFKRLHRLRYVSGIDGESRDIDLPLTSVSEKQSAFERLAGEIRNCEQTQRDAFIHSLFAGTDLDPVAISQSYMINWAQVGQLAGNSLVTIGAHTVGHLTLNRLEPADLRRELVDSKAELEARLGRPVLHLAYPFGGASAVGAREFAVAQECGFVTASTTRTENLFPRDHNRLHSLPRLSLSGNYPVLSRFEMLESGLITAREGRGKKS